MAFECVECGEASDTFKSRWEFDPPVQKMICPKCDTVIATRKPEPEDAKLREP